MARLARLVVLATAVVANAMPAQSDEGIGTPLTPLRPANALAREGCGRARTCPRVLPPLHRTNPTSLPPHDAWILTHSPHHLAVKLAKAASPGPGGAKGGTVIKDDGSVEQNWKGFVSLPGDKFQDRAGFQTVVSGDSSTVAVSSPMATGHGKEHTGKVQIYTRNVDDTLGVVWHQVGEDIYGDTPHEQSGYAIALNFRGDTIAIGSPYYNRTHDENEESIPYAGQVRVFSFEGDAWVPLGKPIRGTQGEGRCGFSVHMGGNGRNIVLGCPRAKDYAHVRPSAGMVKVMKYDEDLMKWEGKGSPIYGNATNILAGIRVSMSGDSNTMAFIAPGSNDADESPGRVRVFTYKGAEWEQMGEPIVNWDKNDKRGRAMSMSRDGKVVAVGSPQIEGVGHTRIYVWDETAWTQRGDAVPGGGSYHETGTNVALNTLGDIVAIGAPMDSDKGKTAGRVRIYHWDEERVKGGEPAPGWALKGQQLDGDKGDTNGFSVHLSGRGNMVTIGAPQYKWRADQDAVFFNAATEEQLDMEDDQDADDESDDEDEDGDDVVVKGLRKRVALTSFDDGDSPPVVRTSSGGDADGKQYSDPRIMGKEPGAGKLKTKGNGRAHVLGAFKCMFLGDIKPAENPYGTESLAQEQQRLHSH